MNKLLNVLSVFALIFCLIICGCMLKEESVDFLLLVQDKESNALQTQSVDKSAVGNTAEDGVAVNAGEELTILQTN